MTPGRQQIVDDLNALWRASGAPTTRSLAQAAGCSHGTVANLLTGRRLPTLRILLRVVEALNGDGQYFADRYAELPTNRAMASDPTTRDLLAAILDELQAVRAMLTTEE